ncbi:uncharacterized protein BDR25DRAFT_283780 [Lindgomyces ingoldianus]|uniref:Uncharacterized protein n=1 Tax=Lindgomyces ingoldianus TaxID=673940 RepID=A0ACB6R0M3_9PLEO|nr:uncharacterized protein BDR25DRAFT_283780 [Lindgomyces ingoldianus]KAF2472373.1 hypothetical protein BDR25DRAFT_283780 [Lindgomyces ingoldianus]
MAAPREQCAHEALQLEPSTFAEKAGFERSNVHRRIAATTKSGKRLASAQVSNVALPSTFPGPLVLPNDDLALDPKWPPQSFRSWLLEKQRNKPTSQRQTFYIAAVPEIPANMAFMKEWVRPNNVLKGSRKPKASSVGDFASPEIGNFVDYLGAFYRGISVKRFPGRLRFVPWEEKKYTKSSGTPKDVGLAYGDESVRIRVRPSPDGVFNVQLNLNDILDAALQILPEDAYSIMILTDHDIYEDEDDDYCCGRAYGGSRIAVVSTARYHPSLDKSAGIDHAHMWPASHCKKYVDGLCAADALEKPKAKKTKIVETPDFEATLSASPIREAIDSAAAVLPPLSKEEFVALWFSRLARTVAHELGHCLGMDHCVYYACNMQGTAGMAEDIRQPPYLCPVCLSKVSYAKRKYMRQRYEDLIKYCDTLKNVGLFAGYGAWLNMRLKQMEQE